MKRLRARLQCMFVLGLAVVFAANTVLAVAVSLTGADGEPLPTTSIMIDDQPAEDDDQDGVFFLVPGNHKIRYTDAGGRTYEETVRVPDRRRAIIVFTPEAGSFSVVTPSLLPTFGGVPGWDVYIGGGVGHRDLTLDVDLCGPGPLASEDADMDTGVSFLQLMLDPHGLPYFACVTFFAPCDGEQTLIMIDWHPTPGLDTEVSLEQHGPGATLLLGVHVFQCTGGDGVEFFPNRRRPNGWMFDLGVGASMRRTELELTSDETGGGGPRVTKTSRDHEITPRISAIMTFPCWDGVIGEVGVDYYRTPDLSVRTASPAFGWPYRATVDSQWGWQGYVAVKWLLGGP